MRDLGNGRYEITNTKTGDKKIVTAAELPKYGLSVPASNKSGANKLLDFIGKIPIIGQLQQPLVASTTGLAASIKTPQIEKQTMENQMKALKLARQAQKETDPKIKQAMLTESRMLSQGAGQRATDYANTVEGLMPSWARGESPSTTKEKINAYAAPSARAGLAAGELAMLLYGVPKLGMSGTNLLSRGSRIAGGTAFGAGLGAASGATSGDNLSAEQRIEQAKSSAKTGAILGSVLSTVGEITSAITNTATFKQMMTQKGFQKLNIGKAWADLARKSTEGKTISTDDYIEFLKKESQKLSGQNREKFLNLVKKESIDSIADDVSTTLNPTYSNSANPQIGNQASATNALDVRRNIKPATWLQKILRKENITDKFDVSKYKALNAQLHNPSNFPELLKYDKYLTALAKTTKIAKPLFYTYILDKVFGKKLSGIAQTVTGQ